MYEEIMERVLNDKRVRQIPILFITQMLIALEDLGLMKEIEDDVSVSADCTR